MAKKNERISINQFELSLTDDNVVFETLENTTNIKIQIKKTISLTEMIEFVKEVVESCIDIENAEFIPEAYDFAIREAVLTKYANFELNGSLDKRYYLLYNTGAFNQVMNHVNNEQFQTIIAAIDRKIRFMLDVMSSTAISKINEVINKFNEIAESGEGLFGSASAENISNIISAAEKLKGLDKDDVARAVLESKLDQAGVN